MTHKVDFSISNSSTIATELCRRLEEIRLSRNISQALLADEAGVSRSTITRMADGKGVSLDSFIRVMQALRLSDQLAALLPDPDVRPIERVKFAGAERRRASGKRNTEDTWSWGENDKDRNP